MKELFFIGFLFPLIVFCGNFITLSTRDNEIFLKDLKTKAVVSFDIRYKRALNDFKEIINSDKYDTEYSHKGALEFGSNKPFKLNGDKPKMVGIELSIESPKKPFFKIKLRSMDHPFQYICESKFPLEQLVLIKDGIIKFFDKSQENISCEDIGSTSTLKALKNTIKKGLDKGKQCD